MNKVPNVNAQITVAVELLFMGLKVKGISTMEVEPFFTNYNSSCFVVFGGFVCGTEDLMHKAIH